MVNYFQHFHDLQYFKAVRWLLPCVLNWKPFAFYNSVTYSTQPKQYYGSSELKWDNRWKIMITGMEQLTPAKNVIFRCCILIDVTIDIMLTCYQVKDSKIMINSA